jgi:hypothetical protein
VQYGGVDPLVAGLEGADGQSKIVCVWPSTDPHEMGDVAVSVVSTLGRPVRSRGAGPHVRQRGHGVVETNGLI